MAEQLPRHDFTGKVVLITGAGRGIGRACAMAFAESGADVALGLLDAGKCGTIVDAIEALGRQALALQMDVRDLGQVRAAVEEIGRRFGRLDICVNNAGLGPENPAELVTEADFDLTVGVNIKGTFFVSSSGCPAHDQARARRYNQYQLTGGQ